MTIERHIILGRCTALISFLFGTGIFGLYFLTSLDGLLLFGYVFILLIGLINIGILISILLKATNDKDNRKKLLTTCGLMLLNIPIVLFYCWISIILLNTMRITFTNSTQVTLTDINIIGCETEHIDKLDTGQSKKVWVEITGDCIINIDYLSNGQRREENVVGYVTGSMGQKMRYNIGGQKSRN